MDAATHKQNFKPIRIRDLLKNLAASCEESSIQKKSQRCSLTPQQATGNRACELGKANALTGFKEKNPSLARWIPGIVYRLLSKILRIDFMNKILYHHGFRKNVDFARASIEVFNVTLANIRKFLRIRTNLEMFFLPNETCKHREKHFVVTFGKFIPWQWLDDRFTPGEWANKIREFTYELADNHTLQFPYKTS